MVYEFELALIAVISSAMGVIGWIAKKLVDVFTAQLVAMTANQAKIATLLEILANKLSIWDERWIDIKRSVDITISKGNP